MKLNIGIIKGDGIGPEIVTEAMKVLDKVGEIYGHTCDYTELLLGGASIDVHGVPLTDETVEKAKACDAVLMGSIGGDAKTSPWYQLEPSKRPEAGLLRIRKELGLFANLRPAVLYEELEGACPLKPELTEGGFDFMIMRELTGGLYFGERKTEEKDGVMTAVDTLSYNENEIRRIAKRAFDIAGKRSRKVTSVDKANVLDSSRLWRKVTEEVAAEYEGELTEEKIQDILERYAPGTPDGGFWTINSTYNTVQNSFGNMDGSYNGLTVEEAFPDYQGEKPLLLGYSSGYTGFIIMGMYLMTGFGFVLIIALAPVFSEEYSRKTDALLLTSRHGKRLCGWSKILASYLFTLLTAGVFLLTMIGAFLAGFGLTGGESSIQLNDSFLLEDVPYFMSCMDAAFDCLVLWLAGALILTALTLVLSV